MACNALQDWTISSLIAIFFKLVKAFILLWVASIVFFVAKFLSFFGLHLPCSCNDIIQDQNSIDNNVCVQRVIIEWPFRMISSTECHILSKFPFKWSCTIERSGSSSERNANSIDVQPVDESCDTLLPAPLMLKGGLSYCNSLGPQDNQTIDPAACSEIQDMQTEFTATKSGFGTHAPDESEKQKADQKSSQDSNAAPSGLHGNEKITIVGECNSSSLATSVGHDLFDIELPGVTDLFAEDTLNKILLSNNCFQLEKTSSLPEVDVPYRINDLRKQLKEEREARKALSLELDQERNAAQTAAEETLAMISRIQSEKASAEMEARQFKRIVEEKSVYDEEAIEILKEIVVKLERERLDIKDEVEMYRRSLLKDRSEKWERGSYADSNEDNLSIHDVHVVRTPTKRDLDKNMISPLSLTPDRYHRSCLHQGISENGLEDEMLREDNSAGISSGCEYENQEARERKTSNAWLYSNSRNLYDNGLEGIQSHDLRTKSMIRRDMARMKAEDEIEHLSEKLLALLASRESAISSMQYINKETVQKNIFEDIVQSLRDMHRLKEGGESVVQELLPSESDKSTMENLEKDIASIEENQNKLEAGKGIDGDYVKDDQQEIPNEIINPINTIIHSFLEETHLGTNEENEEGKEEMDKTDKEAENEGLTGNEAEGREKETRENNEYDNTYVDSLSNTINQKVEPNPSVNLTRGLMRRGRRIGKLRKIRRKSFMNKISILKGLQTWASFKLQETRPSVRSTLISGRSMTSKTCASNTEPWMRGMMCWRKQLIK